MAPTHAALLRGINVGGHARVPMADLRALATGLGLNDVRTIGTSGNLLFSGGNEATARDVERALSAAVGFTPPVIVRSLTRLVDVASAARREFPDAEPQMLVGIFLSEPTAADPAVAFSEYPEDVRAAGDDLIADYVNGQARSKLGADRLERILGVAAVTVRNINTIEKLAGYTT
ncbi:DUF1697 domain-containing protein [Spelaeicoccus albus]|uniref:Uncharacterized protein (DUF1697 family) n=1 Tax=Spelaeicoccus albus TaxID=1280376 RepID=A0A7Z0D5I1_9MICO|nr:DUF1697 domain-containing protein [Spelaeicoccus albus]NYI69284.1 uncharacterized protein (DUF1697 family) [Spelaeicoccus albus]